MIEMLDKVLPSLQDDTSSSESRARGKIGRPSLFIDVISCNEVRVVEGGLWRWHEDEDCASSHFREICLFGVLRKVMLFPVILTAVKYWRSNCSTKTQPFQLGILDSEFALNIFEITCLFQIYYGCKSCNQSEFSLGVAPDSLALHCSCFTLQKLEALRGFLGRDAQLIINASQRSCATEATGPYGQMFRYKILIRWRFPIICLRRRNCYTLGREDTEGS